MEDIKTVFLLGGMPKPRIYKRINLAQGKSSVSLICWDRTGEGKSLSDLPNVDVTVYSQQINTDPISRMLPYAKYRAFAIDKLVTLNPDVLHVQGLDMLMIACKFKDKYRKKVRIIYEIPDLNRILVDKQSNPVKKVMQSYLRAQEKKCCKQVDILVITSNKFYDEYFKDYIDKEKVFYFPNVPDLTAFDSYKKQDNDGEFTLGFLGIVRYKEQMRNLLKAAEQTGIHVLIAGNEINGNEIEEMARQNPKVQWVGKFDFATEASGLYQRCDAIYSVYDADMHNVRIALPNKLYEAVWCELPILVAKGTYLSEIVQDWGVGVSVDHKSVDELIAAIKRLEDKQERLKIEDNCRKHKSEIDLGKFSISFRSKVEGLLNT